MFAAAPATSLLLAGALAMGGCREHPQPAPAPDGGDAQRLVSLVEYIAGDYPLAVQDGAVVSPAEYEEQVLFAADAQRLARGLLRGQVPATEPLLAHLAEVEARVKARAPAEAVAAACRAARDEAVARFGLRTTPTERPSLARAEELYALSCATCHGARGDADTERARTLDPPPASFRDPARLADLSPYRVYNALTFGVPGTGMASFDTLPAADRWSLAFYVFRLGHEGTPARGPVAMPLADMATRSDRELADALRLEGHPAPAQGAVWARREAAFREPPAGVGLDRTRRMVKAAVQAARERRTAEADGLALDAYLQGFEPLEPRLRSRDPRGTLEVEAGFRDFRAALVRGDAATAQARGAALDDRLARLGGQRAVVPALSAFLIYFREGIEAALLVGMLLAGLRRLGRPETARFVHAGWIAALPAGLATWWLMEKVVSLGADQRELVEGLIALSAAAVLFSVSFWLISRAESRRWMGYLHERLETTLTRRRLVMLAGLSFLAVYREAAETVLFTQALLLDAEGRRGEVWAGAAAGLAVVAAIALIMGRAALRLPLGPFFAVSGALLCALAISFAGSGIYELVSAGYLPPRPVSFPEIPWMGIHPELTGLLVQLVIVSVVAGAAVLTLWKRPRPS
ncbi:MAG TPA: cytochrome c/FTR1 family iron permease [Vicinamibacteria bacterium]|nr:cytochrome c/FTR1 family iron permease [Vicinamibacteria bacterium]